MQKPFLYLILTNNSSTHWSHCELGLKYGRDEIYYMFMIAQKLILLCGLTVMKENPELRQTTISIEAALKPPPLAQTPQTTAGRKPPTKKPKAPIAASMFSVADLQAATNSFSQDNLIGEGVVGRVYRAELPDGKVLTIQI
jgi:hypothetical protein